MLFGCSRASQRSSSITSCWISASVRVNVAVLIAAPFRRARFPRFTGGRGTEPPGPSDRRAPKALGVATLHGLPRFVSQQIYYSLQARDAEYELIPAAVDQGLGVLVWSPLAGGLPSGKYRRDRQPPPGSRQLTDWNEPPARDRGALYDTVDVLRTIGEDRGRSPAHV